jgi:hemerythrin superfamily protein
MDAIRLLEKDHREVEQLFERYRRASDPKAKNRLIEQITEALSKHMAAEEQALYPVLRDGIPDGKSLMRDAVKEHREARGLLAEIASSAMGSFDMDAKVATLRLAIDHHVKDEEEKIFPRMRESMDAKTISAIGTRIAAAKKSSPAEPSRSAAKNSPGKTVRGVVSAAADRVSGLLSPPPHESGLPKARPAGTRRATRATPRATKSSARKRAKSS